VSAYEWTLAARRMGASLIYAPKLPSDPLSNLGLASLPDGELRNGAALGLPGLSSGAVAAALDGSNDYIETGWATRTNLSARPTSEAAQILTSSGKWTNSVITAAEVPGLTPLPTGADAVKTDRSVLVEATDSNLGYLPNLTFPAAGTYVVSIHCFLPASWNGGDINPSATAFTGGTSEVLASALASKKGEWQRIAIKVTVSGEDLSGNIIFRTSAFPSVGSALYMTGVLIESGATLGSYFPTTAQLGAGEAGWSGAAHLSESDLGPYARGTQRTFVILASRADSETEDTILGSSNGASEPCLKLNAGVQDVVWSANSGESTIAWAGAWPGNQRAVHCALVFDGVAKTAALTIDATALGSKASTAKFNAPGTVRLGVRNQNAAFWNGSLLPCAIFLRALSVEEVEELYRKSAASVPRSTKPPLELDVEIETHDGDLYRWDSDSRFASRRPQGMNFQTQRGEGFGPGGVMLTRRVMRDYPDLNLLDKIRFVGRNGEIAYAGRVHDFARTNEPQQQFSVTAIGPMAMAKFRRFSEPYIDSDLTGWGEPCVQEKAALIGFGFSLGPSVSVSAKSNSDADQFITMDFSNIRTVAGQSYIGYYVYSSGGPEIGDILFEFSVMGGPTGGATWVDQVSSAADPLFTEKWKNSPDLNATPTVGSLQPEPGAKYAAVFSYYGDGGSTEMTDLHLWRPKIVGRHGLPLLGSWPDVGFAVSDILAHIFTNFTPLTWAGESTTYPVKHAAYRSAFPYDAAKALNDLHLWELAVYDDEQVLYYPADLTVADWQVRTDDPGVRFSPLQGDSIDGFANGVEVTFTDFTGETHTIYPDEAEELRDTSESNPANLHGVPLWVPFDCPHPTTEEDALQMGRAKLADYNRPKAPGTITIKGGYIKDAAGHWQQGWKPKAGQTIALTDHPNDAPRLITSTPSWNQDAKELTISVDNGFELLDVFIAREKVAREAAGFR
jgi:hypothetical protein